MHGVYLDMLVGSVQLPLCKRRSSFSSGSVLFRNKHKPNIKAEECLGMPKTGWQARIRKVALDKLYLPS